MLPTFTLYWAEGNTHKWPIFNQDHPTLQELIRSTLPVLPECRKQVITLHLNTMITTPSQLQLAQWVQSNCKCSAIFAYIEVLFMRSLQRKWQVRQVSSEWMPYILILLMTGRRSPSCWLMRVLLWWPPPCRPNVTNIDSLENVWCVINWKFTS